MVLFATFSRDGSVAITGCDDNNAYIWSLTGDDAGKTRFVLQGHTASVTSAAISPDGRRAVTGSQDGIAKLWDLESGKEIMSLKRHTAELSSAHFAPDGSGILTSSLDQTTLVWPAIRIGPSIKFSASRLEIGRSRGEHPLDPSVRIFDPDASNLAGCTLTIRLADDSAAAAATLKLLAPEQNPFATLLPGNRQPTELALRLGEGATTATVERLLRTIAIVIDQPLENPHSVEAELTSPTGESLSRSKAIIQSADAPESASLAATVVN
jgi:hypothetical protein